MADRAAGPPTGADAGAGAGMRGRTRRWVEVLGLTILALMVVGVLVAGRTSSRPWHRPRPSGPARIAYAAGRAAAPSTPTSTSTPAPAPATAAPAAASSAGLSIPTTASKVRWVEHKVILTYQGLTRGYLLFRPAQVSATPLPVVVELAGCCVNAGVEANRANFRAVAGPAILVYPEYYKENWNAGACCGPPATAGIDDVGFVTTVIDRVKADQPDASQGPVYLAGYSNGGKLAMELACREPTVFSAVAVYGATRTSNCNGPPPESVLVMAGTADPEVAIGPGPPVVQNGYTEPTVNQLVTSYLTADGCTNSRQTVTAGTALMGRWADCSAGRQVGEVLYRGQTHNWPETSGASPSGQQVMWDFFVDMGA